MGSNNVFHGSFRLLPFFLILYFCLISCSKEEVIIPPVIEAEIPENLPPNTFDITVSEVTHNTAIIQWEEAKDPEGKEVTYLIYLNNILHSESKTTLLEIKNLQETTAYTIKILARDPELNERSKEISFTTLKYYSTFKISLWNDDEDMHIDFKNDYIETSDNHLIFIGTFMDKGIKSLSEQQLVVFKINLDGEVIWRKVVPSLIIDMFPFNKIKPAGDGGFVVLTNTRIIKFNSEGDMEWMKEREYVEPFFEYRDIVMVPGQGYFAIGNRTKDGNEVILLKLDDKGEIEWHKYYGNTFSQEASSIVSNGNGTFTFFGNKENSGVPRDQMQGHHPEYNPDFWLVTVNSIGDILWEKTYGGVNDDEFVMTQLIKTRDNGFAFVGLTLRGYSRFRSIYRISSGGDLLWHNINGNGTDLMTSIAEAYDGGFYTLGNYDNGGANQWLKLQKFTADGNLEYERKYYDFSFLTYGGWVKELSNGQLIMPFAMRNFYRDLIPGNIFIVKTKPRGEFDQWTSD